MRVFGFARGAKRPSSSKKTNTPDTPKSKIRDHDNLNDIDHKP
jgi:hypothetical protein